MGTIRLGDFAIFGFTEDPEGFLKHRLSARLGIAPRTLDFGTAGCFFFYASHGDVAESEEAIALKLGFVRSVTQSPLSTQQLLDQKITRPQAIENGAFRGNALVACFSKTEPSFCVYQTVMALPQLYYTRLGGGILCATDLRCLLAVLERIQVDEDAIPMHFLFRLVPGPLTYFRDVRRLFPGQVLRWHDGNLDLCLAQDLRLSVNDRTFDRLDSTSIGIFCERMREIMGAYLAEIQESGRRPGNLLSGGVDSSVLQLFINEQLPQSERPASFSYAFQTDTFEFEIEYARHASELLQTQHTFCDVFPQDYPDLLNRTVEILGQPILYTESAPGKLALAEFLASNWPEFKCFFAGQAADALHGVSEVRKVALFEMARQIPGSHSVLQLAAALLAPLSESKSHGLREVARMLAGANTSAALTSPSLYVPTNYVAIIGDLEMARRCFGDQALLKAFDYRRSLEAEYLSSGSMVERAQVIDLLTAGYEPAVMNALLFAAYRKDLVQFYLDEEVIRLTLAFDPKIRFLKGFTTKPILKQILARRSFSALAEKEKGATTFTRDLYHWMKHGPLQEMVQAIDVPSFVSKSDFDQMLRHPSGFLWNLLTFDVFQKRVVKRPSFRTI